MDAKLSKFTGCHPPIPLVRSGKFFQSEPVLSPVLQSWSWDVSTIKIFMFVPLIRCRDLRIRLLRAPPALRAQCFRELLGNNLNRYLRCGRMCQGVWHGVVVMGSQYPPGKGLLKFSVLRARGAIRKFTFSSANSGCTIFANFGANVTLYDIKDIPPGAFANVSPNCKGTRCPQDEALLVAATGAQIQICKRVSPLR